MELVCVLILIVSFGSFLGLWFAGSVIESKCDDIKQWQRCHDANQTRMESELNKITEQFPENWVKTAEFLAEHSGAVNPLTVWWNGDKWVADLALNSGKGDTIIEAIASLQPMKMEQNLNG